MSWIKIYWNCEYQGLTLPQVLFKNPGWFFWMVREEKFENKGQIAKEAEELNRKARRIRIPDKEGKNLVADYYVQPSGEMRFAIMEIVPEKQEPTGGHCSRKKMIDLRIPFNIKSYDKLGNSLLIKNVKGFLFQNSKLRMTRKRCEAFFDNDSNFVL